ncbi:Delta(14)-sterol reductase [Porphyridium purpureum]|uniref:Delta(14)-sterol reductase n=1 Tax=Porphyridium purpureum TaxID=35688 RepID=A0A5J4Z2A5_PORPP|nr:Delta(14)-sterol reductase [Porphyridium purpureum]|eukprot:POR9429..scf208_2
MVATAAGSAAEAAAAAAAASTARVRRWWVGYLVLWACIVWVLWRETQFWVPRSVAHALQHLPKPSWTVLMVYLTYLLWLVVLGVLLPGYSQKGARLADGSRLTYKCNGLLIHLVTSAAFVMAGRTGVLDVTFVARHFWTFFATVSLFSLAFAIYLFVIGQAYKRRNWFVQHGLVHDFVIGTELNPHVLGLDVKFFAYRPALNGWQLVNLSFLFLQYAEHGEITARMAAYQLLTGWYVFDYFLNERKMVFTWDIIAENFGLMLVWGDLAFTTFCFSLQNLFLLNNLRAWPLIEMGATLCTAVLGYTLFRGANSQKHAFKEDPERPIWGKPPVLIGGKLLASGYWGWARKINFLGDLLLAISYSLPCGMTNAWAYFYFIYLLLLLLHREMRDHEKCSAKYGALWEQYCQAVPARLLPFVY